MIGIAYGLQPDFVYRTTLVGVHNMLPRAFKPVVLIQDRRCIDEVPRNQTIRTFDKCDERSWNETFFLRFVDEVRTVWGSTHDIEIHDTSASIGMQIQAHTRADVVIGHHGAGLTNTMFMRPGAMIVELVGFWDGRILPLCGHYGPFASVFNVHHFIFNFDSHAQHQLFEPTTLIRQAKAFHDSLSR